MIYFIQETATFLIKIGYTAEDDVTERFRSLQTASPAELVLLHTLPGCQGVERTLHDQFAAYRVRGEWFKPGPELIRYIARSWEGDHQPDNPRAWRSLEYLGWPKDHTEVTVHEMACRDREVPWWPIAEAAYRRGCLHGAIVVKDVVVAKCSIPKIIFWIEKACHLFARMRLSAKHHPRYIHAARRHILGGNNDDS